MTLPSLFLWIVIAVLAYVLLLRIFFLFKLMASRLLFMLKLKRRMKRSNLSLKSKHCPLLSLFFVYPGEDFIVCDGEQALYKVKFFPYSTAQRILALQSKERYCVQKKVSMFLLPYFGNPDGRRIVDIEPYGMRKKKYSSSFSSRSGQNALLFHPAPFELIGVTEGKKELLDHGSPYGDFVVVTPHGLLNATLKE